MFSKELYEMDRNEERFMFDEMKQETEAMRQENEVMGQEASFGGWSRRIRNQCGRIKA